AEHAHDPDHDLAPQEAAGRRRLLLLPLRVLVSGLAHTPSIRREARRARGATAGGARSYPRGVTDAPEAAPLLTSGQRLGEWVLEAPLGRGSYAEVWRARHNALPDRRAAIKVPHDPAYAALLRSEG